MEEHKKVQASPKDLMYNDPNNKSYLLGLKTYDGDDKELQDVKSKKQFLRFWTICHLLS